MRLLGLDFETTGLDVKNDRVTEIGAALWEVETKRPLITFGVFLIDDGIRAKCKDPAVVEMMSRVCGITPAMLEEFGMSPKTQFEWLTEFVIRHKVDYIVAHNGSGYDKPLCLAELERMGLKDTALHKIHWLDTRCDIPHPTPPDSNKLKHLALEQGFINPFAHRAVFDVLTMLRILSNYPIEDVVAYSKEPSLIVRAMVPHPKNDQGKGKDFAKSKFYRWQEVDSQVFDLCWVKKIKARELDAERAAMAPYEVVVIQGPKT